MIIHRVNFFAAILFLLCFVQCKPSELGSATDRETLSMHIREKKDVINIDSLRFQPVLSMDERRMANSTASRGLVGPVATTVVSLATSAVKQVIDNDRRKYLAGYSFGLNNLYFYDQLSNESVFDPVGMQFGGIKLVRTFHHKDGRLDTALSIEFEIDTVNDYEILNNSVFRLRVKNFDLRYAKAKIAEKEYKKLNMDFDISFISSYVSSTGILYDSVLCGKFYLFIRDAPLLKSDPNYARFYDSLKGTLLTGKSFIIPRSFGYHREANGTTQPGYSRGAYSVVVNVKETPRNHFITKLVLENSGMIIDAGGSTLRNAVKDF